MINNLFGLKKGIEKLFQDKKKELKEVENEIKRIKKVLKEKGFVENKDYEIQRFKNGKIFRICFNFAVLAFNYTKEPNVVTLIRSAEIFGAKEIILVGVKPELTNKVSVGSIKWIKIKYYNSFEEAYEYLKNKYKLIALEITKDSKPIFEIKKYPKNACFVIGSEKTSGLPKEVLEKCELVIKIPQYGITGSLNTATTGSIAIFDYVSKNIGLDLLKPKERNYRV
jgi:tRNA G18 (ribose-2'-O)-methylase SpoU